jgi:N,N-dimethylformamidase beta subunit-like, C-terminal/Malectin domain/Abnormal spindle-like microcephaly-assoc'd, ASPM-SPD-2-Hydin
MTAHPPERPMPRARSRRSLARLLVAALVGVGMSWSVAAPAGAEPLYRVNAGGPVVTGPPEWSADTAASPSPYVNAAAATNRTTTTGATINTSHPSLPTGTPAVLFQTERYDPKAGAEMQWAFPVTAGRYEVRLYFAETYSGAQTVGARLFNVTIEGALKLDRYDIYADVGGFTGVMKSFVVTSDATLNVNFARVVENPKVNAIEVLPASDTANQLAVAPSSVAFPSTNVGATAAKTITLTNQGVSGDPAITVSAVTIAGPDAAQFSSSFGGSQSLPPGGSTSITVTFAPTSAGNKQATLSVTHSGTNNPITVPLSGTAAAPSNPIVVENQQPGSTGWQIGGTGFQIANDASKQIKGYASATSINKGGSLDLFVTVNPAQTFTIDVYRLGWYGGTGGRLMQHIGPLDGISQPECPVDATTGLIACPWSASHSLEVPTSWTSGVYLAMLTSASNYQNYLSFVVRDDTRSAALLYQRAVTTDQAYNNYPNDNQTGKSLYNYNSFGAITVGGSPRAVKVSFDRPYADAGSGQLLRWEVYFLHWLERSGYDVSYSTNLDTHTNGARLLNYRGFLSVGHDEYWSNEMVDAAVNARDSGVGLAFFGANNVYWQVRFEASASGAANRVMTCYKDGSIDPVQGPTTTVTFRDPPVNRPEQTLIGIQFTAQTSGNQYVPYIVTNSSHWVYRGSGFTDGTSVPGIVGYETDRWMSEHPLPANQSYTLLSHSPLTTNVGTTDYANSSIYQTPGGAWLFAAGTIGWSWALDRQQNINAGIQRATANILDTLVTGQPPA